MSIPTRPTFAATIAALRTTDPRFPWVKPTPDEDDVAELLADVEAEHQGDTDEPDERIHWGHCKACGQWWPCPTWIESEFLAVQYLGRAADRVITHAGAAWEQMQARKVNDSLPRPRIEAPETETAE